MANQTYLYRNARLTTAEIQAGMGGAAPTIGNPTSTLLVPVTVDTTQKNDLDVAMAGLGYEFVSTLTGSAPTSRRDYGVLAADPTTPAPAVGDTYYNSVSLLQRVYDGVSFVNQASAGSAYYTFINDHFTSGQTTTGLIGKMGWRASATGTGASVEIIAGVLGHSGIVRLEAGTALAGKSAIMLGDSTVFGHFILNASQNQWDAFWLVRPTGSLLATDLEIMQMGFGLEWTVVGQLLNGIYVRFDPITDTAWNLVCANGGTRTAQAGTSAPAVGTWVKLGIRITYPGGTPTAQLMVNDVAEGTPITTNLPTTAQGWGAKIDSFGSVATEPMLDLDETEVKQLS